ncbi:serpin family protein [Desertimonas flava]|uniref:serpin family protein n=1 Tax=Desertimonas flava TaxID=2064846 RepID=UPI000E34F080|nr:serpin family protein [Desertimonas flava]
MISRASRSALFAAAAAVAASATFSISAAAASAPVEGNPAAAVNQLAGRLLGPLAAEHPDGNLVYSPFSASVALTMAMGGAAGETLAQMEDVLGLRGEDTHAALAALIAGVTGEGGGSLNVANSLWAQDGMSIEAAFDALLRDFYDSELMLTDFRADPAAARDAVNAWVAERTADRIPELLGERAVSEITRFILVNAIYLDAEWRHPFDVEATWTDDFVTASGDVVEVEMMHQTLHAEYSEASDFQAVTLPYSEGFEMVVVVPDEGTLGQFEQQLADAGGDLDAVLGAPTTPEVALSLPKWDIETATTLSTALQSLGMVDAFDADTADFTGITTDEEIFVGDVIHQANITVTEAGTEAAAATAVVMVAGAAPNEDEPDPVVVDVDQPFFFAIRSADNGAILFQGHVNDPS